MKIAGIKFATTNCGIKYKNRDDLILAVFDDSTNVAGLFTKSKIVSQTILWCKKAIKNGRARALIVNAGNANTFTGKAGVKIVKKTVTTIAKNLNCKKEDIFVSSTGVIGEVFDYKLITKKIPKLIQNLSDSEEAFTKAAHAIMTTDTKVKISQTSYDDIIIKGFAKGSGMIAPNMATMLAYIFTNAKIDKKLLLEIFKEINEETFNSITVDSDCSTNDTALIFATNKTKTEITQENSQKFKDNLKKIMLDLAKKIVLDGEGAKKIIAVKIIGAKNNKEAKIAAFSVANSPLVKSAIAASDPNWGRIMMAIGKSGSKISNKNISLKIGEFFVAKNGGLYENYNEDEVHQYLKNNNEVKIEVDLGLHNQGSSIVYGCDLNEEYVSINKNYRT